MKKRTSSIWMTITLVAGAATFLSLSGRALDGRWGGNPALAGVVQTGSPYCNSEVEACPKVAQASQSREDNALRAILLASQSREDNAPRAILLASQSREDNAPRSGAIA